MTCLPGAAAVEQSEIKQCGGCRVGTGYGNGVAEPGNSPTSTDWVSLMGEVVYRSKVSIHRERGPLRQARLPAEREPVTFGVHGAVAEHYGLTEGAYEPHATTLDYIVAAAGG
jgi:hypothetical protein